MITFLQQGPPGWIQKPPPWTPPGSAPCWPPPCVPIGDELIPALIITAVAMVLIFNNKKFKDIK